jgi:hypothetical protein
VSLEKVTFEYEYLAKFIIKLLQLDTKHASLYWLHIQLLIFSLCMFTCRWHKITNYGGLSIGIPIRERNFTLSIQNNWYFTSIVVLNVLLPKIGLSLGGYPPPSKATEQDN